MAEKSPLPQRLFIYCVALFWGCFTIFTTIIGMFKYGPIKYFQKKTRDTRPACLDDPTLGIHSFIKLKSVRLHYVASGPESKPLMLFLHGFPEFWYSWRYQIRAFNKHYRCVAVDMRGYGESDKPSGIHNYLVETLAEDVKELIEALDYEKCTLVAHDWGGAVGVAFTHFYPKMVQRLVLCNIPHSSAMRKFLSSSFKQFMLSWYIALFQLPVLPELVMSSCDYQAVQLFFSKQCEGGKKPPCDQDDIEAYKWSLSRPDGLKCPINYYRASLQYKSRALPKTPITCPTLMIWGTQDTALAKEMAEMSAKYFTDFTLNYIETSGHWVQMEAPDETNLCMKDFFSRKKSE